jgi:serine protease Do
MSISNFRTLVLLLTFAVTSARAQSLLEKINSEVSSLYESNKEAIVKVYAERQPVVGGIPLRSVQRAGTGFFIDAEGCVLTAATIIEDGATCWVTYRNQRLPATLLGRDLASNIAVLKIATNMPVPCVQLGDSDSLRVGSLVVAVGFPFDRPSAPAVGFVSGFDIQHGFHQFVTPHIRADCRLFPGQAGGPFFDAQGKVVGVAVAARMDNQCYALPINTARRVVADILKSGHAQFGWVGLAVSERPGAGRTNMEVVVQQIYSNSPAANIGFRTNDVLVRIGTNQVRRCRDVLDAMFGCHPGDQLNIIILRENLEQHFTLVVGERPDTQSAPMPNLHQLPSITPVSGSRR